MFTGLKNSILNSLKEEAYNPKLNSLTINDYTVHLPDELAEQMKKYVEVRNQLVPEDEVTDTLLINLNSKNRHIDNAKMFYILKEVIGTNKAASVAKYRILQMIEQNILSVIIKEFTGYSDDVFEQCQEMFDEMNGTANMSEKVRKLDSGLRAIGNYDGL